MRWEELSWDKVRRAQMRWSVGCEECSVKCGAWRMQCEVWSVKEAVRSVKCGLWSVTFGVRRVQCEVWTVKCEVWSAKSAVWSVKCGVLRVQCEVKCWLRRVQCEVWRLSSVKCDVELQMWHVQHDTSFAECTHAPAWLAQGACKFYRRERSYIYIFKATSAPPRAGTTGRNIWFVISKTDVFTTWEKGCDGTFGVPSKWWSSHGPIEDKSPKLWTIDDYRQCKSMQMYPLEICIRTWRTFYG